MKKLVIFDLDGTILNTISDITFNVNLTMYKFGHKRLSEKKIRSLVGYGAAKLIKDSIKDPISEEEFSKRLDFYNDLYTNSDSPKTVKFYGIDKLLTELKSRNIKIAILTNKPQPTTDEVYKRFLKDYDFDMVLGQSEKIKCKPSPEGAELILKTLGIDRVDALYVGDGEPDVLTAKNAGVDLVAALWGYRTKKILKATGATNFAKTPRDVLRFLG